MIIIAGTGRCGTKFSSKLLQNAGYLSQHEAAFRASTTLYNIEERLEKYNNFSESSWMAVPFLSHPSLADAKVMHLVRNPYDVISSFVSLNFYEMDDLHLAYKKFLNRHAPEIYRLKNQLAAAAAHYVIWNRIIEQLRPNAIFHRVEDGGKLQLEKLGLCGPTYYKKCNERKHKDYTLNDIPNGVWKTRLIKMAKRYGY